MMHSVGTKKRECYLKKILCKNILIKILCLVIPIIMNCTADIYAKNNNIRFERISVEQGLSQSIAYCILQDSKGFMWFGTWEGLNKYDGYKFTVYKNDSGNPHSISHNIVRSLYEDQKGMLWIGTEGGLNKFDPENEKFTCYRNDPDDPDSLSHNIVRSVYEDRKGTLWIGTEGGLNKFNPVSGKFTRYQNTPDNPHSLSHNNVRSVYEDKKGALWIGTEHGLNRFDRKKEQFDRYRHTPGDPHSLSHNNVRSLCEDRSGELWIGTKGGLNRFDRERKRFTRYRNILHDPHSLSHNEVWTVFEDHEGILWIGTEGGLNKYDRENDRFTSFQNDPGNPHSLSHNIVWSIFEDRSGVLWIGTYTGGLNKYDHGKELFVHFKNTPDDPNSLSHNNVWSIYEDSDQVLWIGTDAGLNRFDREKGEFILYSNNPDDPRSLSHNEVWSIFEDHSGMLWVGTFGGVNRFDRKNGEFTHYPNDPVKPGNNRIRMIYEDRSNELWVGTAGGLRRFDLGKEQFAACYRNIPGNPHSISHSNVWSIYEDLSGVLWIGTERGLNRFDREKEQFTRYLHKHNNPFSLSNNWVLSIYENEPGSLWIGTAGGLNKFDREKEIFTSYREKEGLPNDVVYGILEDNMGNLWLSTNKGLSRYNLLNKTFKNYSVRDGLQGTEFNVGAYHKNRRGEMFFGGLNGLNIFCPSKKDNPFPPSIIISGFRIFNEPVKAGKNSPLKKSVIYTDEIELSYKDRGFSFEFAALHFAGPEKNQYAYIMEGFDKEWIYSRTRRFATYTNLPAGRYIFKVKASNNDGLWNEKGTAIKITITPPPWRTWWANMLYGMMLAGIAFGYVGYKTKVQADELKRQRMELEQERRSAAILEQKVRERTHELRDEIEERRKIEAELKKTNNYLENVFENSADAIVIVDRKGKCIQWNKKAEELFGYRYENIKGKPAFDYYPDKNELEKMLSVLREQSFVSRYEITMKKKDGFFPCEVSLGLLKNDKDETIGSVFIGRDLTDLKIAQSELHMINEVLKCEIKEREKIQTELEQAKEQLEKAFEKTEKERNAAQAANKKIMDSIRYAENIQSSLLPNPEEVKTNIPNSFIIWMPRDIVGGDIFYTNFFEHGFIIAVIDCTGHGVPGAFMTMIACSGLKRIIEDEGCRDPARILKHLNFTVKTLLKQDTKHSLSDDGLDAGICLVSYGEAETLIFAGARIPLYYCHKGEINVIKGDRQSIGYKRSDLGFNFTSHKISIEKGMCFYMTTDGFEDQFGKDGHSEKIRCFGKRRLKKLLMENNDLPVDEQKKILLNAFDTYRGEGDRQDDVTMVGFAFD